MNLSDYTDEELKEELRRRQPYVDMFGHDWSKDSTHHWEKVEKSQRVGCWTDPFTLQCSTCGNLKGAGAAPVDYECSNSGNLNPLVPWRGFP